MGLAQEKKIVKNFEGCLNFITDYGTNSTIDHTNFQREGKESLGRVPTECLEKRSRLSVQQLNYSNEAQ